MVDRVLSTESELGRKRSRSLLKQPSLLGVLDSVSQESSHTVGIKPS